jgi:REP element-mobilizing transposase RayT
MTAQDPSTARPVTIRIPRSGRRLAGRGGQVVPLQDERRQRFATWGRSRAVRHPDFDYASDAVIHLTLCATDGTPFTDPRVARLVCESVEFRCNKHGYRLLGYCLMPDHLHVLLSPADSGIGIGVWLQRFKSYTGHEYARLGGQPPLWQRSAFDHICRQEETAEKLLTYIVNNPVRAGLVERWQDWPWTKVFIEM